MYLLSNIDAVDWSIDDGYDAVDVCPFCEMPVPDYVRSCVVCGLSIRDIDFEENSINKYTDFRESFDKLFDDMDSKLGNMIFIKDDDELFEFKTFYNSFMLNYDYHEFLEFYNRADKNLEMQQIAELFINDKLNKSLGTESEFDDYAKYLIYYCNYYIANDDLDDAFIYYAQMLLLMSNYSGDNNGELLISVYLFDSFSCYNCLYGSQHSFDISKLFDEAINTFRIEEYNKNHKFILEKLKAMFG